MKQLTSLLIIIFLISCGGVKTDKKQPAPNIKDSSTVQSDSQRLQEIWKKREASELADSIRMAGVLQEALDTAYKYMRLPIKKKEFTSTPDGLYTVRVKIALDNFFSGRFKHLIVHMSQPSDEHVEVACEYIVIYLKEGSVFRKAAFHKEARSTYVSDTLQDVNGDGQKDLLVNWYGSNGCCLKNFYNVYLYQQQTGSFSEGYEFINPTFSAKEHVIRGVGYGHPTQTSLYKYKWNGLQVDTLEYISFEKDDKGKITGKFIRSIVLNKNNETTKEERLNQVPSEYTHIDNYYWFSGKE